MQVVRDIMTSTLLITTSPDSSVDDALELLVEHKVSGLPVVDGSNKVVGIVSDFDLLALETFGKTQKGSLFPEPDQTWSAFKQVRQVLAKGTGKKVSDVMTANPLVVRPETSIDEATTILLTKKIRRLPVVDSEGKLLGAISRRDIVTAALKFRKLTATIDATQSF